MANPLTEVENDLLKAGSFLLSLAAEAKDVFVAEQKLSPEAAEGALEIFTDVEQLISLAAPAAGAAGLNFAADSATYAAFLKLVADAKQFASTAAAAIKAAEKAAA